MIPWLDTSYAFPPLTRALKDPNGLLAAGGDLAPERLIVAYRHGIFPWYSEGQPILWWSPDPRMVLFPHELSISRSLRKTLRRRPFEVRCDQAFSEVMAGCAAPRRGQDGTWISAEMQQAYTRLHQLGIAHSVEAWHDDQLVGGLYGLAIGRAFFGESMFARVTDASKVAFVHLVTWLRQQGVGVIDCQMRTAHLAAFGAREIARRDFLTLLTELVNYPDPMDRWPSTLSLNEQ